MLTPADHTVAALVDYAGCGEPDSYGYGDKPASAGAEYLVRVTYALRDAISDDERMADEDERTDAVHEIADNIVPVYTADIWAIFTDLAAWDAFDAYADEMGTGDVSNAHGNGMTARAAIALYCIAETLMLALCEAWETDDEDELSDDERAEHELHERMEHARLYGDE